MDPFARLWAALAQATEPPPANLADALATLPPPDHLPSPWVVWLLIGLIRHRRRHLWVGDVVKHRLGGDLKALATKGPAAHPGSSSMPSTVPGLPHWSYYFHGRGCCLTHEETGETIDVDFYDDSAEYGDFFFYCKFLKSLPHREPPEDRLVQLHPSLDALSLAYLALCQEQCLYPYAEGGAYRLATRTIEHTDLVDSFCDAWSDPENRIWTAALIGDWDEAYSAAHACGKATLLEVIRPFATEVWCKRLDAIIPTLSCTATRENAIAALADLETSRFIDSRAVDRLIDLLNVSDEEVQCSVCLLLGTAKDARAVPGLGHLALTGENAVRILATQALGDIGAGEACDLLIQLLEERDRASVAALALGKLRDVRALPPLTASLGHEDPEVRSSVTWALGHMGDPSAVEHLLQVLNDKDQRVVEAACMALGQIGSPQAIPSLAALLGHPPSAVGVMAATGLYMLGNDCGLSFLHESIECSDPAVREKSAWQMGLTDGRSAVILRKALDDPEVKVRNAAASSIATIENRLLVRG